VGKGANLRPLYHKSEALITTEALRDALYKFTTTTTTTNY